jgi:hypothetical protein
MAVEKVSQRAKDELEEAKRHLASALEAQKHGDASLAAGSYMDAYHHAKSAAAMAGGGTFAYRPVMGATVKRFHDKATKIERQSHKAVKALCRRRNPAGAHMADSKRARAHLASAKSQLAAARKKSDPGMKIALYVRAYADTSGAYWFGEEDPKTQRAAHKLAMEILNETLDTCGVGSTSNPTSAETAALGAGAGALLLGPVGALAGGYLGVREGKKRKKAKKARTPNPTKRSGVLRRLMRGT